MLYIIKDLLTPESQSNPHHWAATLLAHAMLGVGFFLVTGSVGAVALVYAAWEFVQGGKFWDCVLDWVGVVCGVAVIAFYADGDVVAAISCWLAVLVVGAVGWMKRI